MVIKCSSLLFALLIGMQLKAGSLTNSAPVIDESWQTISNRWGSVTLGQLRLAAENGDATAQYYLGCAYQDGNLVAKDLSEAFKWEKLAADNGLVRAQNAVGRFYFSGSGVEKDLGESIGWYRKAANHGFAESQRVLGWMLQFGAGVETNFTEAAEWYDKAAKQGDVIAQFNLGWMFENGIGCPTNYVEAAKLMNLAALQEQSGAQNNLGWLYANGLGIPQDFDKALAWFQKAAAQGHADAQKNLRWLAGKSFEANYQMAQKYQKGDGVKKDAVEAFKCMQKAAQSDFASTKINDALYELGLMYENGEGVQADATQARNYIVLASAGSQPDACYRVGQMYEKGDGIAKDDYEAARYYFKAVANLNGRKFKSKAAESLLKLYAEGRGLTKTNQQPEDYLDGRLAEKKTIIQQLENEITTSQAEFYIGKIYYQGALVSEDLIEAAARLQVAAEEGSEDANKMLTELGSKIAPTQKEAAKTRSTKLKRSLDENRTKEQTLIKVYGW